MKGSLGLPVHFLCNSYESVIASETNIFPQIFLIHRKAQISLELCLKQFYCLLNAVLKVLPIHWGQRRIFHLDAL